MYKTYICIYIPNVSEFAKSIIKEDFLFSDNFDNFSLRAKVDHLNIVLMKTKKYEKVVMIHVNGDTFVGMLLHEEKFDLQTYKIYSSFEVYQEACMEQNSLDLSRSLEFMIDHFPYLSEHISKDSSSKVIKVLV